MIGKSGKKMTNSGEFKITDFIDEKLYEKFSKHIYSPLLKMNESMTTILRGHLYIENEIEKQLETYLKHPEVLDLSRMKFPSKLDLLVAVGLMDKNKRIPLII
jgi:hypothetical protein